MKEDFGLKQVKVDVPKLVDLDWLSDDEIEIVKATLGTINKQNILLKNVLSTNALIMYGKFENKETIGVTVQNILFDPNIRIEVFSVPNKIFLFGVRVLYLEEEKGKHYLRIVSNLGGKIVADNKEEYDGNVLDNPNLFEIYNDLVSGGENNEQNQVLANAWYSNIPCLYNGCCVIREPISPGSTVMVPIKYNWCGAKCGSGSYVNSVDLCCRAHDKCYEREKSYPRRCNCDKNLISCVSGKGMRASTLIATAFTLKRVAMGCK